MVRREPPFQSLVYQAVELCGRLPLVLSIAGGMLEQHGGMVDESFIEILSEEEFRMEKKLLFLSLSYKLFGEHGVKCAASQPHPGHRASRAGAASGGCDAVPRHER